MRFLVSLPLLIHLLVLAPLDPVDGHAAVPANAARADLTEALQVLHAWDDRRQHAWAGADARALRSLYAPGSGAGQADLRLLRAYTSRGLVVRRIVTQVFAVRVLHRTTWSMRLRVFDRVAGGEMVDGGRRVPLPSSRPVTRDIDLRLLGGAWRVASVSGWVRGPRAARR